MLKNQIKSLLRNKSNILYIIVFILLFFILNIALNLNIMIDQYYDNKMKKELEKNIEMSKVHEDGFQEIDISDDYYNSDSEDLKEIIKEYNEYLKNAKQVDVKEIDRMVRTSNGKELTEEQQEKLRNMRYVERVERNVEKLFSIEGLQDFTVYYILVDSWKNCDKVQKYLDNLGITSYVDWGSNREIVENYEKISELVNVIKYTVCGISLLILLVCCKNIIKNEKENIKLLNLFGYRKNKIKNILFVELFIILLVVACISYFVSQMLTLAVSYYLLKISINVVNIYNFIILIMTILLPTFILTRKLKIV